MDAEPEVSILDAGVVEPAEGILDASGAGGEPLGCLCCLALAPSISDVDVAEPAVSISDVGVAKMAMSTWMPGC